MNKEKNFLSAVLYVRNDEAAVGGTLASLNAVLRDNFEKYEIIVVNDCSADGSLPAIRAFCASLPPVGKPNITLLNMGYFQGLEQSMNAGTDIAIGDFVFEFDSAVADYDPALVMQCYAHLLTGYDIVSASPKGGGRLSSKLFYGVFNRFSGGPTKLGTEAFRILSRRAINRIRSLNKSIPYRKAVYKNCGLRTDDIVYTPTAQTRRADRANDRIRRDTALDAIILFTDVAYRVSFWISLAMMGVTIAIGAYVVAVFFTGNPVSGWTTTMLFLAVAFFGLFLILAFVLKYLSVLKDLAFKKLSYAIESIQKL